MVQILMLKQSIKHPLSMQGYAAPVSGNHDVANAMLQLQYNNVNF